jgi:hypothetical protein
MKVLVHRGDSGDRGETRPAIVVATRAEKPRLWRVGALAASPPRPEAGAGIDRSGGAAAVEAPRKPAADRHSVSAPPEAATVPPAGPALRRGRVRRVQVERIVIRREAAEVWFNDGVEATVPRGPIAERLRGVERSGEMIDGVLADHGNGWIIEAVEAASAEWRQIEVEFASPADP